VHLFGFITKKNCYDARTHVMMHSHVMMHGHMNVKKNVTTQRFIHAYSLNNVQKHCTLYVHTIYTNGVYRLIHVVPHLTGIQITC